MFINIVKFMSISTLALMAVSCNNVDPMQAADSSNSDNISIIDLSQRNTQTLSKSGSLKKSLEVITIEGKVRHFGMNLLKSPPERYPLTGITDVKVWIAEYPFTKYCGITTDKDGLWKVKIIKLAGHTLNISFAYEKDFHSYETEKHVFPGGIPQGWNTTTIKSNVLTVESESITDVAMQMPDEIFLYYAKTALENSVSALIGTQYNINNILVATVGKSWASIYNPALPHGDPGAIVTLDPVQQTPLQGPIYFDESVSPNPTIQSTSVDGGVLFNNLITGPYSITAQKQNISYTNISFNIDSEFNLYIASPPHSIQGSNNSGPGEW